MQNGFLTPGVCGPDVWSLSPRLAWLDGWRGVAILLVLLEHFASIPTGRLGVDLFFVLSGLLISRILFVDRVPLGTFYRRRVARIFPVFYLYLATMTFAGWLLLPTLDWASVGWTAVFLRSYFPDTHIWQDPLSLGNLWSLNVEEHAYLLMSLFAACAATSGERNARWALSAAACVPMAVHVYLYLYSPPSHGTPFDLRTEAAIFPLLVSAAIFLWLRTLRLRVSPIGFVLVFSVTVLTIVVVTVGVSQGGSVLRYLVLPVLLSLTINLLEFAPAVFRRALSARWLTWFGLCSYSIYLWHYPFFFLANHGYWKWGPIAGFGAALLVSVASFYLFEQPMRAWIRGFQLPMRSAKLDSNR